MMTDNSNQAIPKIIDFGLAKMIGPNEKSRDPFGTLGYAAPEVLRKQPYSYSCDVWSLGCVTYAMLCGALPFDSKTGDDIIQLTTRGKLYFDLPIWKTLSSDCIEICTLMLEKNPQKRISLNEVLSHPWFSEVESSNQKNERL